MFGAKLVHKIYYKASINAMHLRLQELQKSDWKALESFLHIKDHLFQTNEPISQQPFC